MEMDIISDVFRKTRPDRKKLKKFGFMEEGDCLFYEREFADGAFLAKITVDENDAVTGKVIEKELDEEYVNIYSQYGAFVNQVREGYISILEEIRDACFVKDDFLFPQTKRIVSHIKKQYGARPEFLWKKFPDYAVFREKGSGKWFAIVMNVDGSKVSLEKKKEYEIIDVRCDKKMIDALKDEKGFHEAYHMNKDSWLSIVLDESLDDEVIFSLIEQSHDVTDVSDHWIIPANPEYYDVVHCFDHSDSQLWKQSSDIHVGDIVYMYVASPYSAILYKCMAEETDIPYEYKDKKVSMNRVMRLRLLKRFDPKKYTFAYLNTLGIRAIRGPRRLKKEMVEKLG